jgi:hypothetical protein
MHFTTISQVERNKFSIMVAIVNAHKMLMSGWKFDFPLMSDHKYLMSHQSHEMGLETKAVN